MNRSITSVAEGIFPIAERYASYKVESWIHVDRVNVSDTPLLVQSCQLLVPQLCA